MKHPNRIGVSTALAALSALAVTVAMAQTITVPKSAAEATAAVDARKKAFKEVKDTFEPLTDMLKRKRDFDAALIATNAAHLQELSTKIPALYTVDTRTFKNIETKALDGIWVSLGDFKGKADAFGKAAADAVAAAKSGDKGATLKAIADVGKSCGACHKDYKDETKS